MTRLDDLAMPDFDFADPRIFSNPYKAAKELARSGEWIARTPTGYLLLGYDDCAEVSRDRRFRVPEALGLGAQGITSGLAYEWASEVLIGLDGDEHTRVRSLANKAFSRRSAERDVRPFAARLIRELVDPWSASGSAVLEEVTNPYAIRVMCHLLGLPDDDWERLAEWADHLVQVISVDVAHEIPAIEQGIAELDTYMHEQVAYLEKHPNGSLGSALLQAREGEDRFTTHEVIRLFESLLMAGSHTTQNQIALGLMLFIEHPDQWAALGADPELAEAATEEVLRFRSPIIGSIRETREPVVLRDVEIPAGTVLTVGIATANFDGGRFEDPDRFDIHRYSAHGREAATPHQSFGGGRHLCIGAHLARVEISEAFRYLAQRMPGLRLDEGDGRGVEWSFPYGIHGPTRMPLRFDVAEVRA